MPDNDDLEKTRQERERWLVDEQFRRKKATPAFRAISAIDLKRAYDVLHHAYAAAQERNSQRLREASRALVDGQQATNTGPRDFTPEERPDFFDSCLEPVALMLLAFALENLLKALLPQGTPAKTAMGRPAESSHDLCELADASGTSLSEQERSALALLSHYSVWVGRYIVPKTVEEYKGHWQLLQRGVMPLDDDVLQALYARLYLSAGGGPDVLPDPLK